MKKLILIIAILLISTSVSARQSKEDIINGYRAELEKCDQNRKQTAHEAYSTKDMLHSTYDATDCYEALIHKIIAHQYSKRAEDHKKALDKYILNARHIEGLVYETVDACGTTGCGTMNVVVGQTHATNKAREIVEDYLRALDNNLSD